MSRSDRGFAPVGHDATGEDATSIRRSAGEAADEEAAGGGAGSPFPPPHRSRTKAFLQSPYFLVPLVFVVVILGWHWGAVWTHVDSFILPKPLEVWQSLIQQFGMALFWENVKTTLTEAGVGFVIGSGAAFLLGVLIATVRVLDVAFMPYLVALQAVPTIALAPLFVVWFGFGLLSKVLIAATIVFFPMLVNVVHGLTTTDQDHVDMLRTFGANGWDVFWRVKLPFALPNIFTGLDIAIVFSVTGAVVGEFVGAKSGLGFQMLQANYQFDIAQLFAILVVLGVIGVIGHQIIRLVKRRVVFWQR